MNSKTQIQIYGKTYRIKSDSFSVDPEEAARLVDARMRELARVARTASTQDLAVLTALNLAHDYLEIKKKNNEADAGMDQKLDDMIRLLSAELESVNPRDY